MSNSIYGELYGTYINSNHFIGTFKNIIFIGDLKDNQLMNDNIFDGNIDSSFINGNLSGSYVYLSNKGTMSTAINGNIISINDINIYKFLEPINDYITNINPNMKLIYENDIYEIMDGDIKEDIKLVNNMYAKQLAENSKLIIVKNNVFYNIIISYGKNNITWNIPYENIVSYTVSCKLLDTKITPNILPRNELYDDINNEMTTLYNQLVKNNHVSFDTKTTYNNLFTPYTVFRYPLNSYFNNAFGERLGVVKNVNPNKETDNLCYIFNDSNNNTHHGSNNGNNVIITNNNNIGDKIYNYEKYNKYLLKINISNMTEKDKQNFINQYSNTYKMDILKIDGIIYGIYITA